MQSKTAPLTLVSISCALAISLIGVASCRTTNTQPSSPTQPGKARKIIDPRANPPAECERRAVAMAAQDRSLKEDPDPGDWSGQVPENGTLAGNSPCDQIAQPRSQADRENAAVLAKTRANMFMQQGRPALAREALEAAFEKGTRSTPDLRNLALDIHDALLAQPVTESEDCTIQRMEAMNERAAYAIEGPARIVLTCDSLPSYGAKEGAQKKKEDVELVVQLRQRVSPGKFTVVREHRPGLLRELERPFQQVFELPQGDEAVEAIYYDVNLLAVRAGHPPEFIARQGVFWFAR